MIQFEHTKFSLKDFPGVFLYDDKDLVYKY